MEFFEIKFDESLVSALKAKKMRSPDDPPVLVPTGDPDTFGNTSECPPVVNPRSRR